MPNNVPQIDKFWGAQPNKEVVEYTVTAEMIPSSLEKKKAGALRKMAETVQHMEAQQDLLFVMNILILIGVVALLMFK